MILQFIYTPYTNQHHSLIDPYKSRAGSAKKKKLINKESKLVPKDSNIHNTSLSSFLHFVVRPDYILQRIRQLLIKLVEFESVPF